MINTELWRKSVEFHGHECGGLTIGYQAAIYAKELLDTSFSSDEEIVCIAENDACGIDAIQVILGCTVGKGNLLFHLRGKQAFSFYNRNTGKSVRLILKPRSKGISREESFKYYQECKPEDMFQVMETTLTVPERARLFNSISCDKCGENTAENMIRLQEGKNLCMDCYSKYNRFDV